MREIWIFFREDNRDFCEIKLILFASAMFMVNNTKTGRVFNAGKANPEVLLKSLGF
jgi:methenyltetrahydromethanopterin cyclohydrolase